jgi:hypothetical protein
MRCWLKAIVLGIALIGLGATANGQELTRAQIKGLDEQVQEIKTDVLAIAAELQLLEEKLLYPSGTQIAVFISLADEAKFRLDAVEIQLGGKPVAHHIYTFKELEALQKGGVQRIYTGNIKTGGHDLQVSVAGKTSGGSEFQNTEQFTVNKGVGPKIVELALASHGITLKE